MEDNSDDDDVQKVWRGLSWWPENATDEQMDAAMHTANVTSLHIVFFARS